MVKVVFEEADDWSVDERPVASATASAGVRRGGASSSNGLPPEFLASGVSVEKVYDLTASVRRTGVAPTVQFKVETSGDERFVAVVRHASGALSFHASDDQIIREVASAPTRRSAKTAKTAKSAKTAKAAVRVEQHFTLTIGAPNPGVRRGVIGRAIKVILLKVVDAIGDRIIEKLVAEWEKRKFAKAGIAEGFVKVTQAGLDTDRLPRVTPQALPSPSGRALLLIHGTFSNTADSFEQLKTTDFFEKARARYGDQIYGLEHFSLSKTPEENARDLLQALPQSGMTFDVVTYSRGGLVLRNIIERPEAFNGFAGRLKLGHAVLVACPNQGTPLATPDRWEKTVGWIATLLDQIPDNPLTTAASFVAEAVVWIAKRAGGAIPGLAAMNANGDLISDIQATEVAALSYSAMGANHVPDANWLQRIADVGVDAFFGQANDLVVPSEGSWRVDVAGAEEGAIGADRVACFGPGGNVASVTNGANHFNFFGRAETIDFIFAAFEGKTHPYPKLNLAVQLPNGIRRSARIGAGAPTPAMLTPSAAASSSVVLFRPAADASPDAESSHPDTPSVFSDAFHITIVPPPEFVRDVDADELVPDEDTDEPKRAASRAKTSEGRRRREDVLHAASTGSAQKYDTALIVASYAGGRVVAPLGLREGAAGKRWVKLISHERKIKKFIDGEPGATIPSNADMLEYGRLLFETLFPKNVRRLYDTARARLPGGRLSVVFTSAIPWVAQVPWEFSWDPTMESFLVTEELEFIRNPLTVEPAEIIDPRPGKLRILVVVAQPLDQNALSIDEEASRIRGSFQELLDAALVELEILQQATPQRLHQYVRQRNFDVVHFIGHGEYDEDEERGYLIFENDQGMTQRVSARSMKEILGGRKVRLVFLNACETGRDKGGRRTDFNRGVAQALVSSGIHSVVANQYLVLDIAAVGFAQHFYWGLARGETIGAAAREARIAVNYSIAGENIDWAVPVVYARDPKARLSLATDRSLKLGAGALRDGAVRSAQRERRAAREARERTGAGAKLKVVVWDMENSMPALERTLNALNGSQETYAFAKEDFGAPLGSLQRAESGGVELYANAAEQRIQRAQQEFGADYLVVVTPRRVMYDYRGKRETGYYGWWREKDEPEAKAGKYAIVSSALDGLPRSGPYAERAITNLLVMALIGAGAKLGTHDDGAKTCPLYFNRDVAVGLVMDKQRLDAVCRGEVKKLMPNELAALEAMLRVFDADSESDND